MRPETPLLAVDIIISLRGVPGSPIVLIERLNPPYGWALPGGFVDVGESLPRAAVREAREETSLAVRLEGLLGCYSDPGRDARGHTVSAIYVAHASGTPRAADDAKSVRVVDPADRSVALAFDHRQILDDFLVFSRTGACPPIRF